MRSALILGLCLGLLGWALDYSLNPNRGAIPQWGGRFAVMAWKEWLELDAAVAAVEHFRRTL